MIVKMEVVTDAREFLANAIYSSYLHVELKLLGLEIILNPSGLQIGTNYFNVPFYNDEIFELLDELRAERHCNLKLHTMLPSELGY